MQQTDQSENEARHMNARGEDEGRVEGAAPATESHVDQGGASRRRHASAWQRFKESKIFGTFVYVYFAVFVAIHVISMIDLLVRAVSPWLGVVVWALLTALAVVCILALTIWRDTLSTFWSD